MRSLRRIMTIMMMTVALGACAISEDIVPVSFQATESVVSIGADGKVFKLSVSDKRGKYKGRIGAKINGFGSEMADIKSTVTVPLIVQDAFTKELEARKLTVHTNDGRALEVSITAFHNNFEVGMMSGKARGIVAFTVKITNAAGATIFDEAISKVNVLEGIMLASGENAAKAVEGALATAMEALFQNKAFLDALRQA